MAKQFFVTFAQFGREEFLKKAPEMLELPKDRGYKFDVSADEPAGTFTISYAGKQKMDWSGGASSRGLRFQFDNDTVAWEPDFTRAAEPLQDAPFKLPFPFYIASTETVILPQGGKGFELGGKNIDKTVAGTHIVRTLALANGKATARSSFRTLEPEISAAEAKASLPALKEITSDVAFVRTPAGYRISDADKKAVLAKQPETPGDYLEKGYLLLQENKLKDALALFDKAAALDPTSSRAFSNKAVVLIHQKKFKEAEAALAQASALSDSDFVVHQAYGMLHAARDKHEEAVAAFTRSSELDPENRFNLASRAWSYERLGKLKEAAADWEDLTKLKPEDAVPLISTARIRAALGDAVGSFEALEAARRVAPDNAFAAAARARLLRRIGRPVEAGAASSEALMLLEREMKKIDGFPPLEEERDTLMISMGRTDALLKELSAALKKMPDHSRLLARRCWARTLANRELEAAVADCTLALEYNVGSAQATHNRGFAQLRLGKVDQAIADFTEVIGWEPNRASSWLGRGIARARKGDSAGAEQDLAAARSLGFDVEADFKEFGIAL